MWSGWFGVREGQHLDSSCAHRFLRDQTHFGASLHPDIEGEHPTSPRYQVRGAHGTLCPGTHPWAEKVLTPPGQAALGGQMCLQERPCPTAVI